ncbi:RidA family protein [Pseudoxanthomonas sp. USHLN014]|uniref:RidA family protein n=1 Tax=Pseudoxanthomonas sp. USHLN014 TaxID=3081297 RepID=UPI00301E241C
MHTRDVVFPEGRQALYTQHRYAPAVRSGGLLFVAGQVGSREDGSPEPDFADQVRQAFAQLQATLKAAGCGLDDVLDVTTFHTDPERQLETVLAIKDEVFPQPPYPTWTAVGVTWLSGFDFEIKVIARLPGAADPV